MSNQVTGHMEQHEGISVFIPNDTFNLSEKGCYISYNSHSQYYGCPTTALVREDGIHPTKFLILNGEHTEAYRKLGNYDACLDYFKKHLDMQNQFSENWYEEIVTDKDGKLHIRNILEELNKEER